MRVIAGEARGKRLEALPGEDVTRPTIERVKEGMFSAIQFRLAGAEVLDLFAGSGQLGIEALSRGAGHCVFLDENREAAGVVMRNCKACGLFARSRVSVGDAHLYLKAAKPNSVDIVLMDPPFRKGILEATLPEVERVVAEGGVVLCESEQEARLPAAVGALKLEKQYKYGTILVWRYSKENEA